MRDRVRKWGRKYPLFDAIDLAVSDNGFKLMCLLYLTPVLPLSIVSYLLGTTSMQLYKFAAAKIAAVPLMLMYVFIGASTDMLISAGTEDESITGSDSAKTSKKISVDDETHRKMVLIGICLSVVSMSLVSHFVKKQLNEIFEKQKHDKDMREELTGNSQTNQTNDVEMVNHDREKLSRRQRGHLDEEKG